MSRSRPGPAAMSTPINASTMLDTSMSPSAAGLMMSTPRLNRRRQRSASNTPRRPKRINDSVTCTPRMSTPKFQRLSSGSTPGTGTPADRNSTVEAMPAYSPRTKRMVNTLEMRKSNRLNRRQDKTVPAIVLFKGTRFDDEEDLPLSSNLNLSDDSLINSFPEALGLFNDSTADKSPKRAHADDEEDQRRARKEKLIAEMTSIRFHTDFERFKIVGKGSFGVVYRCVETKSNVTFAVKRSIVPVTLRDYDLNEVSIFKLIGPHPNIVRYISSWIETDSLFVQMEFCNGGSLGSILERQRAEQRRMTNSDLEALLAQTSSGLSHIHSFDLAHLDIKPDNILALLPTTTTDHLNDSNSVDLQCLDGIVYKLGDFGNVIPTSSRKIADGDCRYLAPELLAEDFGHLAKADIFSLGLTIHEAGSGIPMPSGGPVWQGFRHDSVPLIETVSSYFNDILKNMLSRDPERRMTSEKLRMISEKLRMTSEKLRMTSEELRTRSNVEDVPVPTTQAIHLHSSSPSTPRCLMVTRSRTSDGSQRTDDLSAPRAPMKPRRKRRISTTAATVNETPRKSSRLRIEA